MKCQRCKEREANVQIMQQSSGKLPQTFMLCDVCARELGISLPSFPAAGKVSSNPFVTLSNIFQASIGLGNDAVNEMPVSRCSQCNMTFDDFKKTGFLGCPHCYEAFASQMDPVFLRTQMGKKHEGRRLGVKSGKVHSEEQSSETACGMELKDSKEGQDPVKSDAAGTSGSTGSADTSSVQKPAKKRKLSAKNADFTLSETQEISALQKKHLEELVENRKAELSKAVAAEDYSTAAKIRDEITELCKKKLG
jgi:protein arginine kinase activator